MNESARFLMCPPRFYGVTYVINPWMRENRGAVDCGGAWAQWRALFRLLWRELGVSMECVRPEPGLPDMVFTANAGLIAPGGVVVPSRFRHAERRGEEPHFARWFRENGWTLRPLPEEIAFEGAGDALFDGGEPNRLWAAHGFRTDARAHARLAEMLGVEVVSLHLTDGRFYHLDTCFCPLPGGHLLWYPPAFDAESRAAVEERVCASRRLAVGDADALAFACNAVAVGNSVVLNAAACSEDLAIRLRAHGFTPRPTPLGEFLRAGGAAKCLTLRLA